MATGTIDERSVDGVVNLIPDDQHILDMTVDEARRRLLADDPAAATGTGCDAMTKLSRPCCSRSTGSPSNATRGWSGGPALEFADRIPGRLAVAMGLETIGQGLAAEEGGLSLAAAPPAVTVNPGLREPRAGRRPVPARGRKSSGTFTVFQRWLFALA